MARLIDANALFINLDGMMEVSPTGYIHGDTVADMISDAPTMDAVPRWIPCSERFPEKDGYYLTTTCYRQVYRDFWNEDHFDRTEAVIAWMPLPKPYQEESE